MSADQLQEIDREWSKSSTRKMSYQKMRLYHDGLKGFKDVFGFDQHFTLDRVIDGNCVQYNSRQEVHNQSTCVLKNLTNPSFIDSTLKVLGGEIDNGFHNYVAYVKSLPQDWNSYSNDDLIKSLREFYNEDNKIGFYYWILFNDIENILVSDLKQAMNDAHYDQSKIESALAVVSQPQLITPLDMERLSILTVSLKDGEEKERALRDHWNEYAFMPMYDIDYEAHSLEYFKEELNDIEEKMSREEVEEKINGITSKYEERKEKYIELVRSLNNNDRVLALLEFLKVFASQKDRKPYVRDQGSYYVKNLFVEIAKRLSLSLSEVLFLTKTELEEVLGGKLSISKEELERRIKDSAYFFKDDEVYIFTRLGDLAMIDNFIRGKEESLSPLKGLAVSGGNVKGRVSIIVSNADFGKFKDGQILVTSSTRPDFVSLMKKAAAILTDEGGMLSHAAIVSRELGVPCVVGLKRATQVLKDGDLVEVDADKGVVRILK